MNSTDEMTRRLDVAAYVEEVKAGLSDLAPEDREELVDGLEADLTERLLETGEGQSPHVAFGPPATYADELKAAAGYVPQPARGRRPWRARLQDRFDGFFPTVQALRVTPAGVAVESFLVAVRPVWWFVRAWVALQWIDMLFGSWPYGWMISVHGHLPGAIVLAVATIISVQIGRGIWWPGTVRAGYLRYLVPGLNVLAVIMLPVVMANITSPQDIRSSGQTYFVGKGPVHGLRTDGDPVRNIYAYDRNGQPLLGVQLYDQDGNPIAVGESAERQARSNFLVGYAWPWTLSDQNDETNVFPIPSAEQPDRSRLTEPFTSEAPPDVALPFSSVPALSDQALAEISAALDRLGVEPDPPATDQPETGKADKKGDDAADGKGGAKADEKAGGPAGGGAAGGGARR